VRLLAARRVVVERVRAVDPVERVLGRGRVGVRVATGAA
jgi:hypothetical protein